MVQHSKTVVTELTRAMQNAWFDASQECSGSLKAFLAWTWHFQKRIQFASPWRVSGFDQISLYVVHATHNCLGQHAGIKDIVEEC